MFRTLCHFQVPRTIPTVCPAPAEVYQHRYYAPLLAPSTCSGQVLPPARWSHAPAQSSGARLFVCKHRHRVACRPSAVCSVHVSCCSRNGGPNEHALQERRLRALPVWQAHAVCGARQLLRHGGHAATLIVYSYSRGALLTPAVLWPQRAFNLELAGIRDSTRGNAVTGALRFAFWREVVEAVYNVGPIHRGCSIGACCAHPGLEPFRAGRDTPTPAEFTFVRRCAGARAHPQVHGKADRRAGQCGRAVWHVVVAESGRANTTFVA